MRRTVDDKGRTLEAFLAGYKPGDWPRPSLTADVIVVSCGRRLLLVKRGTRPWIDCWALPGGFVNPDETCPAAAARALQEETGLALPVRPLLILSAPLRDPRTRVVSAVYLAEAERVTPRAGDDARAAGWFAVDGKKTGDTVTLSLTGPENIAAVVDCVRGFDGKIDADRSVCRGDLAFDHAAAIAYAWEELGWL